MRARRIVTHSLAMSSRSTSTSMSLRAAASLLLAMATATSHADDGPTPPSRYRLRQSQAEPAAQRSPHYTLRSRITPAERPDELRETPKFTLIGRFAKTDTAASCDTTSDNLFLDGFEN